MHPRVVRQKHSSDAQFDAVLKELARLLDIVQGNAGELLAIRCEYATLFQMCAELRVDMATLTKKLQAAEDRLELRRL